MKKLLLIICLFSMTVHAEWKFFGDSDISVHYLDYSRMQTEGPYKSIWDLIDYKKTESTSSGKQFKSSVAKNLIDCKASRIYPVAVYTYSEQMGKGEVVYSTNFQIQESMWVYPPPSSVYEGYIKIVCGLK